MGHSSAEKNGGIYLHLPGLARNLRPRYSRITRFAGDEDRDTRGVRVSPTGFCCRDMQ
jgi:hypothetical protein